MKSTNRMEVSFAKIIKLHGGFSLKPFLIFRGHNMYIDIHIYIYIRTIVELAGI